MFSLLNNIPPESNFVATGFVDGHYAEYVASRTKEVLNVYQDDTNARIIASIHLQKGLVDEENTQPKIQVAGDYEPYMYLMGLDDDPRIVSPLLYEIGFTQSTLKLRPSKSKAKNLTYKLISEEKVTYNVVENGTSIENFLYQPKPLAEIIKEKEIDLSWTKNKNYRILTDTAEIMDWVEGLKNTTEIVGFDTETSGLLANSSKKDTLVGICMSYEDNAGVYFPLEHINIENVAMGKEAFIDLIRPYIDFYSPLKKPLVGHNLNFDWKVMRMHDIYLNVVYDTFHRFSIMNISEAKGNAGLKKIAHDKLGVDVIELTDMYAPRTAKDVASVKDAVFNQGLSCNEITRYKLLNAENFKDLQYDFRFAPKDFVEIYGSADADFPRLIHKMMDDEWDSDLDMIYQIEIGVVPALGEQEYYGVFAHKDEFERLAKETEDEIKELEQLIYQEAGEVFKISSSQQKAEILFEKMGCPKLPRFKTKTGWSTDKNTMEALEKYKNPDGTPMYPIVTYLQKYAKKQTLLSSFYSKLPKLIHADHLYASYKQMGAETGRISCSQPNLQQTEPSCRSYMTVDSDEYYFLVCDYSQVEYRLMAGMSGEKKVVDFFTQNPEADYHIMGTTRSPIKLVA